MNFPFRPASSKLVRYEIPLGGLIMHGQYEAKLAQLGVTLPDAPAPAATSVPFGPGGERV